MHPPRVPALQRAPGNTDPLGQLLHPPVAQTSPQGTRQNHRSGPVDATTQEPNRHRCVAFVANRAGETQAPSIGFTRIARSTTRFARIEVAMQRCPATSAAARSGLGSQLFIDAQKKCAERGVQQRPVAHWEGLFCLGGLKRHSTLPRGSVDPDSRGRPPPIPSSNPIGSARAALKNSARGQCVTERDSTSCRPAFRASPLGERSSSDWALCRLSLSRFMSYLPLFSVRPSPPRFRLRLSVSPPFGLGVPQ